MASKLTPAQRVALARHPERPGTADFIKHLFTDFFEQRATACAPRTAASWAALPCSTASR